MGATPSSEAAAADPPATSPPYEKVEKKAIVEEAKPLKLSWVHLALLSMIQILGGVSSDSYVPNLSDVAEQFGCSTELAEATLQVNWFVSAPCMVVIGYLADRLGRKKVMCGTLVIFIVGSVGCAAAPSVWFLFVARIVQGVGEAVSAVAPAIVRDCVDDPEERLQYFALLGMLLPIALCISPTIGGLIGDAFGWRVPFWLLAVWGVILIVLIVTLLPETADPAAANALAPSCTSASARRMFCNPMTGGVLATQVLAMSAVYMMLSNVDVVFEDDYGISEYDSTLLIGSVAAMLFVGAVLIRLLRKDALVMMQAGVSIIGLAGAACILMATLVLGLGITEMALWQTLLGLYLTIGGIGLMIPSCYSLFLAPFKDIAGLASGVQVGVVGIVAAGFAVGSSQLVDDYGAPGMLVSMGAVTVSAALVFFTTVVLSDTN